MGSRATKLRQGQEAGDLIAEIAVVSMVGPSGELFVELPSHRDPVRAFVLHGALGKEREPVGRKVLVFSVRGAIPIVLGLIDEVLELSGGAETAVQPEDRAVRDALVLEAAKSITLSCGSASISALRSGKIVIRGTEITTCASGTNKIKGATVKIN